jgi:phage baseplate assembly protein W
MPLPIISPLRKRPSGIYADFHKDLTVNPITNDIARKLDEEAVKESLKNLLLTDRGERLFQPQLGSDIRSTLFDNNTPATLTILKQLVIDTINNYEPRVTVIDVSVTSDYDENRVAITIYFYLRNKETPSTLTVFLERIR